MFKNKIKHLWHCHFNSVVMKLCVKLNLRVYYHRRHHKMLVLIDRFSVRIFMKYFPHSQFHYALFCIFLWLKMNEMMSVHYSNRLLDYSLLGVAYPSLLWSLPIHHSYEPIMMKFQHYKTVHVDNSATRWWFDVDWF